MVASGSLAGGATVAESTQTSPPLPSLTSVGALRLRALLRMRSMHMCWGKGSHFGSSRGHSWPTSDSTTGSQHLFSVLQEMLSHLVLSHLVNTCLHSQHTGAVTMSEIRLVTVQDLNQRYLWSRFRNTTRHEEARKTNTCCGPLEKQHTQNRGNAEIVLARGTLKPDSRHTACHAGHCANWRSRDWPHRISSKSP